MRLNWMNHRFVKYDGYGRYGYHMVLALHRLGVDVTPMIDEVVKQMPGTFQRMAGLDFSRLTVSLMPPHNLLALPGRQWAYTMTEAYGLPDGWAKHLNSKTERVIVPRPWLVDMFREFGVTRPIDVVPGGIDPVEFPVIQPADRDTFTFGCMGDRGNRKGFDLVYRAFFNAFQDKDDARLIIKTRAPRYDHNGQASHFFPIDNTNSKPRSVARRVSMWQDDIESMAQFYSQLDCFVFPTRGEGEGMPPREAAAMGIPVIATEVMGLNDNLGAWALPIASYKWVDAPKIKDALAGTWAEPDIDELTAHMLYVYENRAEAKQRALAGAQWLRTNETWEHSAHRLLSVLEGWA